MKAILSLLTLSFLFSAGDLIGQEKRGGIFGFSRSNELSSELFPNVDSEAFPVTSQEIDEIAATPGDRDGGVNIFKRGRPEEVEEVSYVIRNGERIEENATAPSSTSPSPPAEKQKKGLFAFGKKSEKIDSATEIDSAMEEATNVIQPIPEATAPQPSSQAAIDPSRVNAPAPPNGGDPDMVTEEVVEATMASQQEKPTRKLKLPFFSKSEQQPEKSAAPNVVDVGAAMATAAENSETTLSSVEKADAAVQQSEAAAVSAPGPPSEEVQTVASNDPVPQFEGSPTSVPEKTKKEGGFFKPISSLVPSRPEKQIDMTGAETIIQNGEIVAESETAPVMSDEPATDGTRTPPRVVNGSTTYSSWDDVEATSVSAASKILRNVR
ncbi:MAG: hypothetical protein AAGA96_19190 [Verrucomicrobiota bacterium]